MFLYSSITIHNNNIIKPTTNNIINTYSGVNMEYNTLLDSEQGLEIDCNQLFCIQSIN